MRPPELVTIEGFDPNHPEKAPDGTTATFMRVMEEAGKRARQFTTLFPQTGVSHSDPTIRQEA